MVIGRLRVPQDRSSAESTVDVPSSVQGGHSRFPPDGRHCTVLIESGLSTKRIRVRQRVVPHCTKLERFSGTPLNDPIVGVAHHLVTPCPTSNSDRASGAPSESLKLVESGALHLRNVFR